MTKAKIQRMQTIIENLEQENQERKQREKLQTERLEQLEKQLKEFKSWTPKPDTLSQLAVELTNHRTSSNQQAERQRERLNSQGEKIIDLEKQQMATSTRVAENVEKITCLEATQSMVSGKFHEIKQEVSLVKDDVEKLKPFAGKSLQQYFLL